MIQNRQLLSSAWSIATFDICLFLHGLCIVCLCLLTANPLCSNYRCQHRASDDEPGRHL